jgi:hypothetical protein
MMDRMKKKYINEGVKRGCRERDGKCMKKLFGQKKGEGIKKREER